MKRSCSQQQVDVSCSVASSATASARARLLSLGRPPLSSDASTTGHSLVDQMGTILLEQVARITGSMCQCPHPRFVVTASKGHCHYCERRTWQQTFHLSLNIDKRPSAGYGTTSNSCAIVRAHYSSFDGVAMAYEGFFYWKNWAEYLEAPDEAGLARYMQSGTILLESATGHHDKVLPHYDRL